MCGEEGDQERDICHKDFRHYGLSGVGILLCRTRNRVTLAQTGETRFVRKMTKRGGADLLLLGALPEEEGFVFGPLAQPLDVFAVGDDQYDGYDASEDNLVR